MSMACAFLAELTRIAHEEFEAVTSTIGAHIPVARAYHCILVTAGESAPTFHAEASTSRIYVTVSREVVSIVEFAVRSDESLPAMARYIVVGDTTVMARVDSVMLTVLPRIALHFVASCTIAHAFVCCRVWQNKMREQQSNGWFAKSCITETTFHGAVPLPSSKT
jgi:hypothetical protein